MRKLTKKEMITIGAFTIVGGTAAYFGFKYFDAKKVAEAITKEALKNDTELELLREVAKNGTVANAEEISFLKFLVAESGCVSNALQNARNKATRYESKIKALTESYAKNPTDDSLKKSLDRWKQDYDTIIYQIFKTEELQKVIDNDDIIM